MSLDFTGKIAVVTGGANGIGFATARALAGGGAKVWIFDLEREQPSVSAAQLGGSGCAVDVSDRASLEAAFAQSGTPDIVVANAGTVGEAELNQTSRELWDRTIAVNLTGVFQTVQLAAALMKPRRRGAIVITASTNSYDGEASLTAYNASKAGLLGIVHTAANELGPYGIRINAVCPGLIRTRLTQRHFSTPEVLKDYFRHIPLGRGGEADEVGQTSAFLASDLASYITGATLFVDGGQMASKFGTWNEGSAEFSDGRWRLNSSSGIHQGKNRQGRVAFQPVVDEEEGGLPLVAGTSDEHAHRLPHLRVGILGLGVGREFLDGVLIGAAMPQQCATHREIRGGRFGDGDLLAEFRHAGPRIVDVGNPVIAQARKYSGVSSSGLRISTA